MNELANELINEILLLGEVGKKPSRKPSPAKKPSNKKKSQQDNKKPTSAKYVSGGRWYSDPEFNDYVGRMEKGKWIDATPEEKAKERGKEPARAVRQPTSPSASQPQAAGQQSAVSIPKKPKAFGDQKLYDEFVRLINSGNTAALQKFVDAHKIQYNPDKDTFYVGVDSNNRTLSSDDRKIFGDSKSTRVIQKAIFDRLKQAGVNFELASSTSPFSPDKIAPPSTRRIFDGAVKGTTITFNGVQYEALPEADIDAFVKTKYDSWLQGKGRNSTLPQRREFREKLAVAAFAISQRHRVLSVLAEGQDGKGPEEIAVYDTDESKGEFIGSLQKAIVSALSPERQKTVSKLFDDLQQVKDPTKQKK
jgi:hypothetical protein